VVLLSQSGPQRSEPFAGTMHGLSLLSYPLRSLFVSPAKAGAQEPQWRRCHRADLSAVNLPPARCMGSRSFRFPCESRGPGAAVVLLPRNGPQRSALSAGTTYGCS